MKNVCLQNNYSARNVNTFPKTVIDFKNVSILYQKLLFSFPVLPGIWHPGGK